MIACLSLWEKNYRPLAEKTLWKNRDEYVVRHGYFQLFREYDKEFSTSFELACFLGFEKVKMILEAFEEFKNCEYVWFADADAMVMNMTIKIEDIIKRHPYDILVGSDCNGSSCGSMIVKNSDMAKRYLKNILMFRNLYLHEQDFFWKNPAPFVQVTDQRVMNSWDTSLEHLSGGAQFQDGDFFIHWPSQNLETRLACYEKWKEKVIR